MSIKKTTKTASEWYTAWSNAEQEIIDNGIKLAGLDEVENTDDVIQLENRNAELRKLADYYKTQYEIAYKIDNGETSPKYRRLRTYNNGL